MTVRKPSAARSRSLQGGTVNEFRRWKFPARITTLDPLPDGRAFIQLEDGSWWLYKVLRHGRKNRMKAKKLGPNTSARLTAISRRREAWIYRSNELMRFLRAVEDLPLPPIHVIL